VLRVEIFQCLAILLCLLSLLLAADQAEPKKPFAILERLGRFSLTGARVALSCVPSLIRPRTWHPAAGRYSITATWRPAIGCHVTTATSHSAAGCHILTVRRAAAAAATRLIAA
jgi:hypothetical protein